MSFDFVYILRDMITTLSEVWILIKFYLFIIKPCLFASINFWGNVIPLIIRTSIFYPFYQEEWISVLLFFKRSSFGGVE